MAVLAWPFRGREAELALIQQAMDDPAVAGIIVAGAEGVGKTRLALEALKQADPTRYVVCRVVATGVTKSIPLGALAQLLPAELPTSANPLRAAAQALVAVGGQRRLLLGVDDAHLLDDVSAALLHQVIRGGEAFVLLTLRSGAPAPGPVTALWREQIIQRFDLLPLSPLEVEGVLTTALGGQVDSTTTAKLAGATRGNALLLRELVVAGLDHGALTEAGGVWHWKGPLAMAPALVELIDARLAELDDDQLHVLELLAYADPLGVDLLARFAPLRAIQALEAQGLLWVEQDGRRAQAHVAHPVYVEALRRRSPYLAAPARQRELAEAIRQLGARRREDTLRIATWYLSIGGEVDPQLLVRAARQASAAFNVPLAERLARAALDAGGGAEAVDLLVTLLTLDGRVDEAAAVMALAEASQQLQQPQSDEARAQLAMGAALTKFFLVGQLQEAAALLAATGRTISEPVWLQQVTFVHGGLLAIGGRLSPALRLIDQILEAPASAPIEAQALMIRALVSGLRGQPPDAAAATVQRARGLAAGWQDAFPWLGEAIEAAAYTTQAYTGALRGGAATATRMHQAAVEHGDFAFGIVLWCALRGQAARFLGQLGEALRWLREGLRHAGEGGLGSLGAWCAAELAHAAALCGDHDLAQRSLAEAIARRRPAEAIFDFWVDVAATWVSACQGAIGPAVEQALAGAARGRDMEAWAYEAFCLHDVVRLGAARQVADRLGELASRLAPGHGTLLELYAAHAQAAAGNDGPGLDAVASSLASLGAGLLAAEAAAQAARAHHDSGRQASSRAARASAARWLAACQCQGQGQERVWTPALAELSTLGVPSLTLRELEVARLAVQGLTNRQIADRLVTAVRTIDNHLQKVYTKLGIRSREDLGRFVDGNGNGDRST
jgi:DNA-binding NarL/FixJ family response regulator